MEKQPTALDVMIAEAEIGEEARTFKQGQLGQTILGMAKQEIDNAVIEFASVDPTNHHKVRDLQLKVQFGLKFESWLDELITRASEALETYRHEQNQK